jgi:diguanylate cyclase (GGDEF)-like protein/PAS domain S-box-containing protein
MNKNANKIMKPAANASAPVAPGMPPHTSNEELRLESERFYRHVIDSTVDGFFIIDAQRRFTEVNEKLCELYGYAREEFLGRTPLDFITDESRAELIRQMQRIETTDHRRYQLTAKRKDGSTFPILLNNTTHRNSQGEVVGAFGFITDLTPIVAAQQAVAESERELRRILDSMQDTYYRTDAEGKLLRLSPGVQILLGYMPDEAIGRKLADFYANPEDRAAFLAALQAGGGRVSGYEAPMRHKDGHVVWVLTNAQYVLDAQGKFVGVEGTTRDISEKRIAQERIDFLAHHDPLTELPNRLLFKDRFERAVKHGKRAGTRTALLFVDLDRFKPINDSHGHAVGDVVLREVAQRLQACVRGTDTVSRQGGDEFMMILTDLHGGEAAAQVAEKVLAVLARPFHVEQLAMSLGASIGIVLSPDDGEEFEDLLRKADAAMYCAKRAGGNRFSFHGAA